MASDALKSMISQS